MKSKLSTLEFFDVVRVDCDDRDDRIPSSGRCSTESLAKILQDGLVTLASPASPTPDRFVGELKPAQKILLRAMTDFERDPVMQMEGRSVCEPVVGEISERFSFGKTILMLALVCASGGTDRTTAKFPGIHASAAPARIFDDPERSRSSVEFRRVLSPTLVISSASVLLVWERHIRKYSRLTYTLIDNMYAMKKFVALVHQGCAIPYDIVLLKCGSMTTSYGTDGEPQFLVQNRTKRSIINALTMACEGMPWRRLIVDDYDSIRLSGGDYVPPAMFTWLVSSTKSCCCRVRPPSFPHGSDGPHSYGPFEHAAWMAIYCQPIVNFCNSFDNAPFNIGCDAQMSYACVETTKMNTWTVRCKGGLSDRILANLGYDQEAAQMIMSGAYGHAADRLGIPLDSATEMVRSLINRQMETLLRLRAASATARALEDAVAGFVQNATVTTERATNVLRDLIRNAKISPPSGDISNSSGKIDSARLIEIKNGIGGDVLDVIRTIQSEIDRDLEQLLLPILRMCDNLREEECQICRAPIGEMQDVARLMVTGCCQTMVCSECFKAQYKHNKIKYCPNCTASIENQGGMLFLSDFWLKPKVSVADEIKAFVHGTTARVPSLADDDPGTPADPCSYLSPKVRVLLEIMACRAAGRSFEPLSAAVHGADPTTMIVDMSSEPMDLGAVVLGEASRKQTDEPDKWLVFTFLNESTVGIEQALLDNGVNAIRLQGTMAKKSRALDQFERDPECRVMVVAASHDCAGLNLPFVSHVVLMHAFRDRHLMEQAVSRAQRAGRTFDLTVFQILYRDEDRGD